MGIFKTGNQANHTYNMKFLIVACLFGLAVASNSYNDNHRRGYRVETRSYGHENRGYGNNGYGNRGYGGDSYGRQESYGSYGRDNRYGGYGGYNNDKSYGKVETREYHNDNRGYGYDNDKSYGRLRPENTTTTTLDTERETLMLALRRGSTPTTTPDTERLRPENTTTTMLDTERETLMLVSRRGSTAATTLATRTTDTLDTLTDTVTTDNSEDSRPPESVLPELTDTSIKYKNLIWI